MSQVTPKTARFKDTMISAADADKVVAFYQDVAGLEIGEDTDSWTMLTDPETGQSLCITKGPSVETTSPGIEVDDIEHAIVQISQRGGRIRDRWQHGPLVGVNCEDPEGNGVMVWQSF